MDIRTREGSETLRNLVTTAAVVIGGAWTLYQWNTIFPKTSADVNAAAASVRTDVSGSLTVSSASAEGGGAPVPGGVSPAEYCSENPGATLRQSFPMHARLDLKSASKVPIRARIDSIRLARAAIRPPVFRPDQVPKPALRPLPLEQLGTLDSDSIFLGGLRENRVEAGQEIKVSLMFDADIPGRCGSLDQLILVQARLSLTAIGPRTDRPVGKPVPKVFVSACQEDFTGTLHCNVDGVEAYGQ